jgi:hypothetical protein
MCNRSKIERAVALDLIQAVYKAEGWVRREGESQVARVKDLYTITADPRRNRYVATPKGCEAVSA